MNRIEAQANYYKNIPLRDRRVKAVVHIEDKADERFWNLQLQHVLSGEYLFISRSRSVKGSVSKGCEQCLRFRPYANRQFFICIDSDLRQLRQEKGLTAHDHVCQTYAYSWESHYCEAQCLQERFNEKIGYGDFDFVTFLGNFSRIVYRPLLLLIQCDTPRLNALWNVTKFNACIPLQPSPKELERNGSEYLARVNRLFEQALAELPASCDDALAELTADNAYLHIQGHRLYDLITHIGSRICKGRRIAFKSEILDTFSNTSGYLEIDSVQTDLRTILL